MIDVSRIALIKAHVKLRQDYNENHDPKNGQFTVSSGGGYAGSKHATLSGAKSAAKSASLKHAGSRHIYSAAGEHVTSFYEGKEPATHKAEGVALGLGLNAAATKDYVKAVKARVALKGRPTLAKMAKANPQGRMTLHMAAKDSEGKEAQERREVARKAHNLEVAKNPEVQAQAKAVIEAHAQGAEDRTLENSAGFNREWYNKSQELGRAGGPLTHYSLTHENGNPLSVEAVSREHAEARARANGVKLKGDEGHQSMSPKEFINTVQHGAYSTFTAENPLAVEGSAPATKEANKAAMLGMLKDLKTQGARFTIVQGKYGNPETTVMAHHSSNFGEKEADALAKKFGQTSVMHADNGKAHMTYVNGPHAGEVHHSAPVEGGHGEHLTFDSKAKNYYTRYHGVKFSFNFPTLP